MNQKIKLIFLDHEPLTEFTKEIYSVEKFIKSGFVVEYWDLHPFLFPNRNLTDEAKEKYIHLILSFDNFIEKLNSVDVDRTIFMFFISDCWKNRHIVHLLSKKKCRIITIDYYANAYIKLPLLRRLKRVFYSNIWKKILNLYLENRYKIFKMKHNIEPFRNNFSTSYKGNFRINHPDYERYKRLLIESKDIFHDQYILFIDNYYPLHPDFKDFSTDSKQSEASVYYNSMKVFFDKLEKKYSIPVVIAAHPKANYNDSEFGNRKIIKYATGTLIQYSKYVVLHASNSISFVVLFDKPLAFIKTNGMRPFNKSTFHILSLAKSFGKNVFNVDKHKFENFFFSRISQKYSDQYINNYITSPQIKDKSNHEILIEKIEEIFK